MKKIVASPVFWLVVLSLLPLTSLVQPGIINAHDAPDHVARIANFYQSLAEGNVVPRWAAHLNWGYGHPILMFLYPLPSYIASVFHFLGFSFVDSTKLVFALSWVASALTMYIWMKCAFGKKAAIFGSLLYIFAPYRFVDFYVRGALGEHVAFIFPPLVLYFLFSVSKERWCNRRWIGSVIGATISLSALILAHNAIAIMFLPIVMIYMAYLFWFEAKPKWPLIVAYFLTLFFCFGLTAFFWIPAYFEGKYTLRDIVTASEALQRFVSWRWFVYSPWNYGGGDEITKSLGFVQWFGILGSFVILWKSNDRKIRIVLIGSLLILIGSLFIMTSSSALIWKNFSLLQKFQFPWRFLSVSVFTAAIIGGVAIDRMLEKLKNRNILFIIICGLIVLITVPQWHPKGYLVKDESFYTGIYPSTTDTGESSPIWSVRFMEHSAASPMEIIEGKAAITPTKRTTTVHEYSVVAKSPSRLLENTLYFPGWKVYIDGIQKGIQFQDPAYRGLITFNMTEGQHDVRVVFEDTKLRRIADLISIVSIGILAVGVVGGLLWGKKK